VQWNEILETADQLYDELGQSDDYFRRMVERSAIPLTIGQLTGLSEGQVSSRLAAADRVRRSAPNTWTAFREGRVDGLRVREISRAVDKLKDPRSLERLDRVGLAYAESHTVSELRTWLKRFVMRVEPESFNARADQARRDRRVDITHGDDGMSLLEAYLPSFVLAGVQNRIDARIAELRLAGDPEDERTKTQLGADIVSEWLLSADHAPTSLTFDVAVTIPVTALTGGNGAPTISADGAWGIPTGWALDEFMRSSPFWHRMIIDPASNDVLSHDYAGRFAPDVLTRAILFRDRVCKAPGCCKSASRCDIDHRMPWPEGKTSGDNLWPLCRRHHNMKGHHVLQWILPDSQNIPIEQSDLSLAS